MSATLVREYDHRPATSAAFEGGVQALPSGDVFLGWGQQPYISAVHVVRTAGLRRPLHRFHLELPRLPLPLARATTDNAGSRTHDRRRRHDDGLCELERSDRRRRLARPRRREREPALGGPQRAEAPVRVSDPGPQRRAGLCGAGALLRRTGARHLANDQRAAAPRRLRPQRVRLTQRARGGTGQLPLPHPCSISTSVSAGRTLLASSGPEHLAANSGGVLYFRLSPAARAERSRAPATTDSPFSSQRATPPGSGPRHAWT